MVKSNTVLLFLLLVLSSNCQLDHNKSSPAPVHCGLHLDFSPPKSSMFSLPSCHEEMFFQLIHFPRTSMPDTLVPSRMGPGMGIPLELPPQVQPAAQDPLPLFQGIPVPQEDGSAAGGTPKPITVNRSSSQAQSFASMKSHFLSSTKYCVKILFSLPTLSLS